MKLLRLSLLGLFILLVVFGIYLNTYYKSLFNTLDPKPGNEPISFNTIDYDLSDKTNYFCWLGQSTVLLSVDGMNIIFDPIFSMRASPFSFIGPKRRIPLIIEIAELPKIDYVFISHNHYDHLDIHSLKAMQKYNPKIIFYVPLGDKDTLESYSLINIKEFDWWEMYSNENMSITFVPTKHWSARGFFDRNRSLWGGWAIQTEDKSFLHLGDTGYDVKFRDYRDKIGEIDIGFIPIGSYFPREIESDYHSNPSEGVQISLDLNIKKSYGIHWGNIYFSQEPTYEPRDIIESISLKNKRVNFHTPLPGEIINLNLD
tara:strand:- start:250 stop:1194 length:945 start_codon:yes stop_codon:yes gene_type:complete